MIEDRTSDYNGRLILHRIWLMSGTNFDDLESKVGHAHRSPPRQVKCPLPPPPVVHTIHNTIKKC